MEIDFMEGRSLQLPLGKGIPLLIQDYKKKFVIFGSRKLNCPVNSGLNPCCLPF